MNAFIDNRISLKPSVIVPDIHGRVDFVKKVFSLYNPDEWDIVFTGDILHTETDKRHWRRIEKHYVDNCLRPKKFNSEDVKIELAASLGSLKLILERQQSFPLSVFVLRGNHDDVSCKLFGDYGKFSRITESGLFRGAMQELAPFEYGQYLKYEKTIPYLYIGPGFLASHTIPEKEYKLEDIHLNEKNTHYSFCWTDNTADRMNGLNVFNKNALNLYGEGMRYWFIGHRPVKENKLYRSQETGRLIQNNHPNKWVVLEVPYNGEFIPVRLESLDSE